MAVLSSSVLQMSAALADDSEIPVPMAAAAQHYPERRIMLRQRTHLLEDTGAR
jgi:hypothetical protein